MSRRDNYGGIYHLTVCAALILLGFIVYHSLRGWLSNRGAVSFAEPPVVQAPIQPSAVPIAATPVAAPTPAMPAPPSGSTRNPVYSGEPILPNSNLKAKPKAPSQDKTPAPKN